VVNNKKKFIWYYAIAIGLFALGVYIFLFSFGKDYLFTGIFSPTSTPIPLPPTATPTPAPKEPSERALRAAVWFYTSLSSSVRKNIEKSYTDNAVLSEDKTSIWDIETRKYYTIAVYTIREMALKLDNNLTSLIVIETGMNKSGQNTGGSYTSDSPVIQQNQPIQQYQQPATDPLKELQQKRQQQCQIDTNKYLSCMSEYNSKMGEYNSCMLTKTQYGYCYKPSNFCYKPVCAY